MLAMSKSTLTLSLSFVFFLCGNNSYGANEGHPTCENMVGVWENQLDEQGEEPSTLKFDTIDKDTGQLQGFYTSPSGTGGNAFKLIGWVNGKEKKKKNNVKVLAFSVHWGKFGSITSWTGFCEKQKSGMPIIRTVWHLVRPDTNWPWDHILTFTDTYTPVMEEKKSLE